MQECFLVRLTSSEYDQVLSLKKGSIFNHINLQHYGIPYELLKDKKYKAVKIIKNGINVHNTNIPPLLDLTTSVSLELLKLYHTLTIKDIYLYPDLLLHTKNKIEDSILERYKDVMNITMNDVLNMQYFVRTFKIV